MRKLSKSVLPISITDLIDVVRETAVQRATAGADRFRMEIAGREMDEK
jgi:hypothetical protein